MKNLLFLYLMACMVSANTGYMPITIFKNQNTDYVYTSCKIGEPCPYLQNRTTGETPKINYTPLYIIFGGLSFSIIICVIVILTYIKWLKP